MGLQYQAIGWNHHKKRYDRIMGLLMGIYILVFILGHFILHPNISPETLIIRMTGTLAILMLHVILMIGPLCRLNHRFLPLLYNRRHLGVSMFLIAAIHGIFSIIQFHTLGDTNAFLSLFLSNTHYDSLTNFPFQVLGFFALLILFLMAASSHDFWLNHLSPKVWKTLHMLVYVSYAMLIMHIMLGVVQLEKSFLMVGLLGIGMVAIIGLHVFASLKGKTEIEAGTLSEEGFVRVCAVEDIPDRRAKVLLVGRENIAVFRYGDKISAVNNVCKHQNGPLGEGKIVDSCIVCPWHGYEYRPEDGCAPPPFHEKVSTYEVKLENGMIWVHPEPRPEGTYIEPLKYQK
ncbi:MAG: Rieske 2Fe-2S domain-containing protein [Bacteroidota bacterium]